MKKIKYLVFFISLFAFCIDAKAASGNLSVSSYDVYENDTFYVTVDVAAAAWNVHVNADGPVIGCSINQADASADAMDTTKSFSTSCTATGTGTISIYLSGDVTSASDGNAVDISNSTSVSVSSRPAPDPEPAPSGDPSPSGNNNDNNNNNNNNNDNNNQDDNKSKNNNVKSISVTGYNLNKIDNNNYSLTVPSNVSSISVNASAEDSKANVSGAGKHDLVIGENTIEVVITSESGSQNKIVLKITRKSENTLDDIDSVLKDDKTVNSFTIGKNDVISKDNIKKIIDSKETVDLNYYDDNKNLIYSWKLDGSKIKTSSDLDTTISFDSDNKKDILKSSNYADGLIVNLNSKNVPEGTKIKLFVGNKYSDSDTVNVYYYDGKELQNVSENLKIQNGYIEIDADNGNQYFITMSDVKNVGSSKKVEGSNSMTIVLLVLLGIILITNIIFIIHVLRKKKKNQIQSQTVESYITVDQPNSDPIINTDVNNTINNTTISNNSIDNSTDNSINNNNININNN